MSRNGQHRQPRILVVENDPATQAFLQYVLSKRFRVDIAGGADEAERLAQKHTYDVALIDIGLDGDTSGLDVLKHLKSRATTAEAAMIACTAYAMPGDRDHFLDRGFDGYISKPFTRERLIGIVEDVL